MKTAEWFGGTSYSVNNPRPHRQVEILRGGNFFSQKGFENRDAIEDVIPVKCFACRTCALASE